MLRKSVLLMVVTALVITSVLLGAALTAHPGSAQEAANMNMKVFIQSLIDQGQVFTINTRVTNFVVDGESIQISQLGDDFLCVSGELNVMGNPKQMICDTFSMIIVMVP